MKIMIILQFLGILYFVKNASALTSGLYDTSRFSLKYTENADSHDFVITSKTGVTSNVYHAFGLSYDFDKMGDDDVAMCKMNSAGTGAVEHYRNTGKSTPTYLSSSNPTVGFSNIVVTVVNGQLVCSFSRLKSMSNVANYFDIKTSPSFYILTATGTLLANGNL